MICNKCMKNIATVKFTEVVDGAVVKHDLCRECFAAHQRDAAGFSVEVPKPSLRPQQRPPAQHTAPAPRCVACGVLLRRVIENAEVGCATCYTTYGKEIEGTLEALHRGLAHRGKVFKCDDTRARLALELQTKRMLLRRVLKAENYEEAARLRDAIAALEAETLAGEPQPGAGD